MQTFPHAPQLFTSVRMSVHGAVGYVLPPDVVGQRMPPPPWICDAQHPATALPSSPLMHCPSTQAVGCVPHPAPVHDHIPHTVPQAPQLFGSNCVLVVFPIAPQGPAGHAVTPAFMLCVTTTYPLSPGSIVAAFRLQADTRQKTVTRVSVAVHHNMSGRFMRPSLQRVASTG